MNSDFPFADSTGAVATLHPGTIPSVALAPIPATPRRAWSWQRLGGKFLVISVLAHLLFGAIATYLVVQNIQAKRKLTFQSGPKSPGPATRALEHKVQMKKQKSSLSAPPQARRVVTTGLSKVALPDMPAMPAMTATLSPSAVSGMGAAGLAPGGMGGPGGGMGGNGGAAINFFGARTGGSGLEGFFYDLKQTPGRQPTGMDINKYVTVVSDFAKGGAFNEGLLARFYKSPKPLYATQIFTPSIPADQAPAAFGVQNEVQPKMWVALYKGTVVAPDSGRYHFVGSGDDVLMVKFDNRFALDACWFDSTAGLKPAGFYHFKYHSPSKGFTRGEAFTVEAGQSYPIQVLIGERPGGFQCALLYVEKEGENYTKDAGGNPILPIFRTAAVALLPPSPGTSYGPHAEGGPVWKVTAEKKPFSVFK